MPFRSVLYVPASNARALQKARGLPCDAMILDLEDAVAPAAKPEARAALRAHLSADAPDGRPRLVRINALSTPWGAEDLAALSGTAPEGILVPKVSAPGDLDAVAAQSDLPLWAMIETARGVIEAPAICAHPALAGIVMGTNDLARELGARSRPDRLPLMSALQGALMAARMAGITAIDGVCNALDDPDRLAAECAQGRDLGFDGKSLIHPAQIAAANAAFAPGADEIDLARRRIAAHEAVLAAGQGVAVVDGEIVESLHVEAARATLAFARDIEGEAGA
ncbi:HpcH/HpaI aldolase/citrate lyase family protein [Limimaricola hongkongensis]|uniref:L-malyl-CoA/beta-methylmalyl-CoA lyase n=1 Tax=Limimaricola hongkongensis DSM 17492 TaxID=1122180 RepID=A0A017HA61_9RHOB|nr:CoA ester lyase [Limimaricola hongkongensis]EYD70659.1 L-malyl-CoA/beta-methylmalyl-CoA lyase [Limimaricola hongkongensis DSM 17492]